MPAQVEFLGAVGRDVTGSRRPSTHRISRAPRAIDAALALLPSPVLLGPAPARRPVPRRNTRSFVAGVFVVARQRGLSGVATYPLITIGEEREPRRPSLCGRTPVLLITSCGAPDPRNRDDGASAASRSVFSAPMTFEYRTPVLSTQRFAVAIAIAFGHAQFLRGSAVTTQISRCRCRPPWSRLVTPPKSV